MKYKYRVIYGDGRTETTNNKTLAKKWANERTIRATVVEIETGNIVYENAIQRRINKNYETLRKIADACKNKTIVIK